MDAQEKYSYWLDIAQYDLETAVAMFDSGRWLSSSIDKATARDYLNQTSEAFAWLLTQKP
jgi:hypothetical protein